MPRTGATVLTRRSGKQKFRLSDADWRELEGMIGRLTLETKDQIASVCSLYAWVGPLHSKKNAVSSAKAASAIDAWLKASGRLRAALGDKTSVAKMDRAAVIMMFHGEKKIEAFGRMLPLSFARCTLTAAMGAMLTARDEINDRLLSPHLKGDMWLAWVKYIAVAVAQEGVNTSASSSHKLVRTSPFVDAIMFLQRRLPKECHRFGGYESVAKGVQLAKRKFPNQPKDALLAVIAAWGTGVLPQYAPDKIASAVAMLEEQLRSIRKK